MTTLWAAAAAATFLHSLWDLVRGFVRQFGALAFFPLGVLDMSVIPVAGIYDILLIALSAAHTELWWYYALMATAGSIFGALFTFQLGREGGEAALEKYLGASRSQKVFSAFRRWGFGSLFVGAIAPPPMPASALVLAAGTLDYPWPNFVISWTLGRLLRYGLVAWISMRYGRHIFGWLGAFSRPVLWTLLAVAVAAAAAALCFYLRRRRRSAQGSRPKPHRTSRRAA